MNCEVQRFLGLNRQAVQQCRPPPPPHPAHEVRRGPPRQRPHMQFVVEEAVNRNEGRADMRIDPFVPAAKGQRYSLWCFDGRSRPQARRRGPPTRSNQQRCRLTHHTAESGAPLGGPAMLERRSANARG